MPSFQLWRNIIIIILFISNKKLCHCIPLPLSASIFPHVRIVIFQAVVILFILLAVVVITAFPYRSGESHQEKKYPLVPRILPPPPLVLLHCVTLTHSLTLIPSFTVWNAHWKEESGSDKQFDTRPHGNLISVDSFRFPELSVWLNWLVLWKFSQGGNRKKYWSTQNGRAKIPTKLELLLEQIFVYGCAYRPGSLFQYHYSQPVSNIHEMKIYIRQSMKRKVTAISYPKCNNYISILTIFYTVFLLRDLRP